MAYDVPATLRAHVAIAIRVYVRQLERDGWVPPAGLAALADRLLAPADRAERRRYLNAVYQRRSKARKRAARSDPAA